MQSVMLMIFSLNCLDTQVWYESEGRIAKKKNLKSKKGRNPGMEMVAPW